MVVSLKKHFATENRSLEWCLKEYPRIEKDATELIKSIKSKVSLDSNPRILEIGAAQGLFMIALKRLGYDCDGIEPLNQAHRVCRRLEHKFDQKVNLTKGVAETLYFKEGSFDVVIGRCVIERVKDVRKVLSEVYSVLKPGGCFYFLTASALCPKQNEIRFFPFFSWYPLIIKRQIMKWALKHKPSLIGYTHTPAVNWFTPWKAEKLLKAAGFKKTYDHWDLLTETNYGKIKRNLLKLIRSNKFLRVLADFRTPFCRYLAIK